VHHLMYKVKRVRNIYPELLERAKSFKKRKNRGIQRITNPALPGGRKGIRDLIRPRNRQKKEFSGGIVVGGQEFQEDTPWGGGGELNLWLEKSTKMGTKVPARA